MRNVLLLHTCVCLTLPRVHYKSRVKTIRDYSIQQATSLYENTLILCRQVGRMIQTQQTSRGNLIYLQLLSCGSCLLMASYWGVTSLQTCWKNVALQDTWLIIFTFALLWHCSADQILWKQTILEKSCYVQWRLRRSYYILSGEFWSQLALALDVLQYPLWLHLSYYIGPGFCRVRLPRALLKQHRFPLLLVTFWSNVQLWRR